MILQFIYFIAFCDIIILMADNLGVDAQHIVPPSQMKKIWEQNILKKKQEAEELRRIAGGGKVVVEERRGAGNDGEKAIEQRVEIKRVEEKRVQEEKKVVEEKREDKIDSGVNTQGMSLKERMKVWEQVTGAKKAQNISIPVKVPEPVFKAAGVVKQQPVVIPQPIMKAQQKPIEQKIDIIIENVKPKQETKVLPAPVAPIAQPIPQPKPFSEPNPGIQTSFIPASKRISLWQNNLTKHNAQTKKSNEQHALISKQFSRLSFQEQSTPSQPKPDQRSTYMPAQSSQINLQQIIGSSELQSNPFSKKPAHHEPAQPQMTIKQRMLMMKETLEKTMKQKQTVVAKQVIVSQPQQILPEPKPVQPQHKQQIQEPQIKQQPQNIPQQPLIQQLEQPPSNTMPVPSSPLQTITAESLKARAKNRRTYVDFDDA